MKTKLAYTQKNFQLAQPSARGSFFLAFIPHKQSYPA